MKLACAVAALLTLSAPVSASASGPLEAMVNDLRVVPFEGGCLAEPGEWRLRPDGGVTLLAGDCPPGGGYYDTPFADSALAGNLTTAPVSAAQDLRALLENDWAEGAPMEIEVNGLVRPAYTLQDRIGDTVVRIIMIAGPAGDVGRARLQRIAEDWMQWLRKRNP